MPDNILGIKLGMSKENAEKRLREVAEFQREADQGQEMWTVKDKERFDGLAIGYDREKKVKFITAFSNAGKVKKRMRFSEVGDIGAAKQEITKPHHRYTWIVEEKNGKPGYVVTIYGADPEYLSIYSLAYIGRSEEEEE